ncbi:MAG TPA: cytochrome c oxidase subunit 3 [Planctomycetota bacterium]|nr:cytochrome c oxidase subunit 3 [Planctomycetota bacterium]
MSHAHVIDPAEPAIEDVYNGKLAMWLFLCSEVMFFSGLLGAYIALRLNNPEIFEASQKQLHDHVGLAAFNTLLLISSSLTMALAVLHGQNKNTAKQRLMLLVTAVMGTLFLGLKFYEYSTHIRVGEVPSKDMFFAFYYTLTGLHGFHILCGVVPMVGLWYYAGKQDVSAETEMVGLYWHFVDLVWIFLFPMLYLI